MKIMKRFLIVLVICAFYSCNNKISPDSINYIELNEFQKQADIDSVKGLISKSFQDIWSDLDSTKIKKHHTTDYFLLENGVVWNNDSISNFMIRARIRDAKQQSLRINRFDFLKTVHNKSTIWIAYDNFGTWIKENDTLNTAHWLESAVAKKEGGKWKIQQLHSTYVGKK
ncbi:DUF4440 domain-containing protein [Olleya sp. 1-3]|nr:DUF4440 domain-containing protein [Olleya sp. 1-3]